MKVYHGNILTVDKNDTVAEYLVENCGRIVYVGDSLPEAFKDAKTIELREKALVPSFVDTHIHFASFATFYAGLNVMEAKSNSEMFQFIISYLYNDFGQSNIMGMDAVYVHLANNYYLKGQTPWVDVLFLDKVRERIKKMEPNLLGKIAPEIIMRTSDETVESLRLLKAEYTIVVFWETDCGHCQKVIPEIWKIYQKYEKQEVKVFAVYTQYDKEKWTSYINEHKLFWINVYDSEHNSNFRSAYDIYSTPTIYLLDKDKKIIAKRISTESLDDMLERLLSKK